jgi:elongation factor P--(R)-beta-lysine ligase
MNHVSHMQAHKNLQQERWAALRSIREFFWDLEFTEVETPLLVRLPGQEPYLSPMSLRVSDHAGVAHDAFLQTSPEYTMKKFLAAGYTRIFSLNKVFRDREKFGDLHNPEFTMLEWYRADADFYAIMDDVASLILHLENSMQKSEQFENKHIRTNRGVTRIHMRDVWKETVGVNLDNYIQTDDMIQLCRDRGHNVASDEQYENAFYTIFLNDVEPTLKDRGAVIIHHYPAPMAALAKLSDVDPRYAERFELYMGGIEIANAFTELTDATAQRERLEQEYALRQRFEKDMYPLDEDFLAAVAQMPKSSGIALGVDRLLMVLLGQPSLYGLLPLPARLLWESV